MTYIEGTPSGYDRGSSGMLAGDPKIVEALRQGLAGVSGDMLVEVFDSMFQREQTLQATDRGDRRYDHHVYDGLMMLDDELAEVQPRYADLRTNLIRRPVQYLMSVLTSLEIAGRVYPSEGGFGSNEELRRVISDYDKRLKSVLHFCNWRNELAEAIRDAAIVGEGYIHDAVMQSESDPLRKRFMVQYVDWRNVWCDSNSRKGDLSDANHLFFLRKMPLHEALFRWPEMAKELKAMSFEDMLGAPVDEQLAGDGSVYSPSALTRGGFDVRSELDRQNQMRHAGKGGATVYIVQCYVRLMNRDTGAVELNRCILAYDESLTKPVQLSGITQPYRHNRIPFSRITYARYGDSFQPYSPLVRNKRGYEKMMTWLLRAAVRYGTSKGLIFDPNRVTMPGQNPDKVVAEYRRELAQPVPIIKAYGGIDSLVIEKLETDLGKIMEVFTTIKNVNDEQGGISPELIGAASPNMAGVALEAKRDETMRNFPEIVMSLERAVQGSCERILSNIEQFAGEIQYGGVIGPAGEISPMEYDGDASIMGNRMLYHVDPQPVSRSIMRDQLNVLAAAIQKIGDPFTALGMMPALARLGGGPDSAKLEQLFIELAQITGAPVPPSLLTEDQRQAAEQQAASKQQEAEQAKQIEQEMAVSEIDKTKSQAFQARATGIAQLTKDSGETAKDEEIEALRDEAARRQREYELSM